MQKLLQYLSLAGKGFGIVASLTAIPGVPQKDAILIFFAASVLKDVANRFSEFIEANYITPSQAKLIVGFLIIGAALGAVIGCTPTPAPEPLPSPTPSTGTTTSSGTTTPTSSQSLVTTGYEIENFLQHFNTGADAIVPPVDQFLTETHNSGDAQTVALYATLATQFASVVEAGLDAALPPQQVQAAANSALAPAAVLPAVSNVIATTPAETGTATGTVTPTTYDIRPVGRDSAGNIVYGF